jgi:thiamine-phosphate pyrophosphorylase
MHDKLPNIFCFINNYEKNYIKRLPKNTAIIFRNYNKNINKAEIIKIKTLCKKSNRKFFLANNIKIAIKLNLDGVYIPSFNRELKINYFTKKKNFKILGSAHNILEIRQKEKQGVNCIFISPVFITKKSNKYLGIHKFNNLANYTSKKIICLGGIKKNNIKKIKLLNTYGFSSVSLFKKKIKYISF